jgi:hypothetical protein
LIILVGADKGGVGKTTVARALDDYLQHKHANQRVFDAQWKNGDLVKFAPSAEIINIDNVDHQMKVFDSISGVTLVDLCAGQLSPTLKALRDVGLLNDVRDGRLAMALLHVIGTSLASLREIAEISAAIGGSTRHIFVKNLHGGGFDEWEKDDRFANVLRAAAPHTIIIPEMVARASAELQRVGGSFDAFANNPENSYMLRGYVRNWLTDMWAQFAHVDLDKLIAAAIG